MTNYTQDPMLSVLKAQEKELSSKIPSFLKKPTSPSKLLQDYASTGMNVFKEKAKESFSALKRAASAFEEAKETRESSNLSTAPLLGSTKDKPLDISIQDGALVPQGRQDAYYELPQRSSGVINDEDLEELLPIVYGEVSNRTPDKQELEARVLLNTALNRLRARNENGENWTLARVLREPNQYQAFDGEQYKQFKAGAYNKNKANAINTIVQNLLGEIRAGTFADNTNGAMYYIHNDDGSITYDDTRPYANTNPYNEK